MLVVLYLSYMYLRHQGIKKKEDYHNEMLRLNDIVEKVDSNNS